MAISLPLDLNRNPIQLMPAKVSLASTYDTTVSASTEITLNAATSMIEVSAITQAILMKWGTADVSTSSFDHIIQAGSTMQFVVPIDTTAVNFIEQAASAILVVNEF